MTNRTAKREAAGCLLIARDTCALLLLQRSPRVSHGGEWGIPGGGYEPTDLGLAQTALRETMEEAGLAPRLEGPLAVEKSSSRVYTTFLGTLPHEVEPLLNWEHTTYCWCPVVPSLRTWRTPGPLYSTERGKIGLHNILADRDVFAAVLSACRTRG